VVIGALAGAAVVPFTWMAQLNVGGITVDLCGFDDGVFAVRQHRE
jgi:hypothetical protein